MKKITCGNCSCKAPKTETQIDMYGRNLCEKCYAEYKTKREEWNKMGSTLYYRINQSIGCIEKEPHMDDYEVKMSISDGWTNDDWAIEFITKEEYLNELNMVKVKKPKCTLEAPIYAKNLLNQDQGKHVAKNNIHNRTEPATKTTKIQDSPISYKNLEKLYANKSDVSELYGEPRELDSK